jgi:hypothetical protein
MTMKRDLTSKYLLSTMLLMMVMMVRSQATSGSGTTQIVYTQAPAPKRMLHTIKHNNNSHINTIVIDIIANANSIEQPPSSPQQSPIICRF